MVISILFKSASPWDCIDEIMSDSAEPSTLCNRQPFASNILRKVGKLDAGIIDDIM